MHPVSMHLIIICTPNQHSKCDMILHQVKDMHAYNKITAPTCSFQLSFYYFSKYVFKKYINKKITK